MQRNMMIYWRELVTFLIKISKLDGNVYLTELYTYVLSVIDNKDTKIAIKEMLEYLPTELKGGFMSIADQLKAEGVQQRMQQGMQQRINKEKKEIAINLLHEGISTKLISKVTDLSIDEIQELAD